MYEPHLQISGLNGLVWTLEKVRKGPGAWDELGRSCCPTPWAMSGSAAGRREIDVSSRPRILCHDELKNFRNSDSLHSFIYIYVCVCNCVTVWLCDCELSRIFSLSLFELCWTLYLTILYWPFDFWKDFKPQMIYFRMSPARPPLVFNASSSSPVCMGLYNSALWHEYLDRKFPCECWV